MLRSAKVIFGYDIKATDGELGSVRDLYFDDETWDIRYLVADTRKWLPGRKVLIAPEAMGQPDWENSDFPVNLTMDKVKNSPGIEADKPVSRQQEIDIHNYYGWSPYWNAYTGTFPTAVPPGVYAATRSESGDNHLRSIKEVTGYHLNAGDGEIGHVDDFIVEDHNWNVRYFIVDTRNILPGNHVIISRDWVQSIGWSERVVSVDIAREMIEQAPPFDPSMPVNREYEERLYDFYGRPRYWLK